MAGYKSSHTGTQVDTSVNTVLNDDSKVKYGNIIGTLSDQTDLQDEFNRKVDKEAGKGLSTNDYTTAEKTKLAGIQAGAQVNTWGTITGNINLQTDLQNALSAKVPTSRKINGQALTQDITIDALPSQTGQSGKFLTTNGTNPSWQEIPTEVDGETISLNTDDELQAIGIKDNRNAATLKYWTGTRAQYNAITNKDSNTIYNITDDTGGTITEVAFSAITGQPTDNTNLATALNAKANNNAVVKLTGNQTVAGVKTFTDTHNGILNYYQINLSSQPATNFYPVVFNNNSEMLYCEINSPGLSGSADYNMNSMTFLMRSQGWCDTPPSLKILEYGLYSTNEICIMQIVRGLHEGNNAIYLRGGLNYTFKSNRIGSLKTSDYTVASEKFPILTDYGTGTGTNIGVWWRADTYSSYGKYTWLNGAKTIGEFVGPLIGNASTATKATQDSEGNQFTTKYQPLKYSKYVIQTYSSSNKYIKLATFNASNTGPFDISSLFWVEVLNASVNKGYALVRLSARWSGSTFIGTKFEILEKYGEFSSVFDSLVFAYKYTSASSRGALIGEIWMQTNPSNYNSHYFRPTQCNEYGDYSQATITMANDNWTYYQQTGNSTDIAQTAITADRTQVAVVDNSTKTQLSGKLNNTAVGSASQPVYINSSGVATACTTSTVIPLITTYVNGTSGYNIWSNGYCEQWGSITATADTQTYIAITFAKTFANTNYSITSSIGWGGTYGGAVSVWVAGTATSKATTGFTFGYSAGVNGPAHWRACGYLAEGQY